MRILLIEDDTRLARQIADALGNAGYTVDRSTDGEDGWFRGDSEDYDAVILDLGLPAMDGLSVLRRWRNAKRAMPVLILTARASWREKVTGLREGADDYLAKPFEIEELRARIEALIRRACRHAAAEISSAGLCLDPSSQRISRSGAPLDLTALEYRALAYLMMHQGKVVSKTELTEHIYGQDDDRDSNVIEVLINRLRKKIGAELIRTRRGQGYAIGEQPP
ncbi:MAG: response regulator transcription factor [Rhodopseudomonas sp.]|uniref:response regulator transcription factor n=1 Tax=Rhodopseudomonas sp. TaxID=1078 RepID=UPI0018491B4F|nr:response regulator transcription factor [Rhodopseudomonas sp.]NVN84924.1 response regulator transcription factor [Rhodopseudomonas sp.]